LLLQQLHQVRLFFYATISGTRRWLSQRLDDGAGPIGTQQPHAFERHRISGNTSAAAALRRFHNGLKAKNSADSTVNNLSFTFYAYSRRVVDLDPWDRAYNDNRQRSLWMMEE
jgi:hypothetical protein